MISACTRLVLVGPLDAELRRRHRAVVTVDAEMIAATRPEVEIRTILARALGAYASKGYPDEW